MSRVTMFLACAAALALAAGLSGCSAAIDSTPPATPAGPQAGDHGDQAGHDHGEHPAQDDDPQKEKMLADLPPEDRAAVDKQRTCPVSGALLWSMGQPYKVTVAASDGTEREVFLCCQGCESTLKADPAKFLAKLHQ